VPPKNTLHGRKNKHRWENEKKTSTHPLDDLKKRKDTGT